MKYIKLFSNHTDYESFIDSSLKVMPNLCSCNANEHVHLNYYDPVIAYLNVTSTETPIMMGIHQIYDPSDWDDLLTKSGDSFDNVSKIKVTSPSQNIFYLTKEDFTYDNEQKIYTYVFDETGDYVFEYELIDHTKIESYMFFGTSFNNIIIPNRIKFFNEYSCAMNINLSQITLPKSIISFNKMCFAMCNFSSIGLENSNADLKIPNTITKIPSSCFGNITNLRTVELSDYITEIESNAFSDNPVLESIIIGSGITYISSYVFIGCPYLTSFTIKSIVPPTIESSYSLPENRDPLTIYVPAESVNAYKTATNWSNYASRIQAIPES